MGPVRRAIPIHQHHVLALHQLCLSRRTLIVTIGVPPIWNATSAADQVPHRWHVEQYAGSGGNMGLRRFAAARTCIDEAMLYALRHNQSMTTQRASAFR